MCGLYYVDDELENEIERIMRLHGDKGYGGESQALFVPRNIHPTDLTPVLTGEKGSMKLRSVRWGLPGFQKGQVIFNARKETVMDKPTFHGGMKHGRIVIPAAWFYEWNKRKEKSTFRRLDGKPFYLAGFCCGEGVDERFAMLTTCANESMLPVHDRMPLILEEAEIPAWLFADDAMQELLDKDPPQLARSTDYEQLNLFDGI